MNTRRLVPTGCTGFMLMLLALTLPFGNDCGTHAGVVVAAEPFVVTNNISSALMQPDWDNLSDGNSRSDSVSGTVLNETAPVNSTAKYFYEKPRNTNLFGFHVEENTLDIGNWSKLSKHSHFDNEVFTKLSNDGKLNTDSVTTLTPVEVVGDDKNVNSDRMVSFKTLEQFDTAVQDKGGIKTIGAVANGASVEPVQTGISGATEQKPKVLSGANFDTVMASISR